MNLFAQWPKEMYDKLPSVVFEHIAMALEHGNGERTMKEVREDIQDGSKQVWVHSTDDVFDFTMVTQIVEHPSKKICEVVYSGGSGMLKALDEVKVIEEWAKLCGCTDIHAIGRKYMVKSLAPYGYTQRYVTVGREL